MLPTTFYNQPTLKLAKSLLGQHLVRKLDGRELRGRIVEVEAYHQDGDAAAHSYNGQTQRNAVMFGPAGHLYVYFIYGVHYCMNVVSEREGVGAAVLIRAIEPLAGLDLIQNHRGTKVKPLNLTNGPAKCCQAFAIGPGQNGLSLNSETLFLEAPPEPNLAERVFQSPRIGISKATELCWRFYIEGNPYVSKLPKSLCNNDGSEGTPVLDL